MSARWHSQYTNLKWSIYNNVIMQCTIADPCPQAVHLNSGGYCLYVLLLYLTLPQFNLLLAVGINIEHTVTIAGCGITGLLD